MDFMGFLISLGNDLYKDNQEFFDNLPNEIDRASEQFRILASIYDANTSEGMEMITRLYV